MNHLTEYSIDGGFTWLQGVASEATGDNKSFAISGLSPGSYTALLRITPLSGSNTLPALSNTFTFSVVGDNTGVSANTLRSIVVGSDGKVMVSGSAVDTLVVVSTLSAGSLVVTGLSNPTLSAILTASIGKAKIIGDSSSSLAAATASSAGIITSLPTINGSASNTLVVLTASAVGTVQTTGSESNAMANAITSAAGTILTHSALSQSLASATIAATGTHPVTGSSIPTLGTVAVSSGVTILTQGIVDKVLTAITTSVSGTVGSSAPTQPVITATGGDTQVVIALASGGTGATTFELEWRVHAGTYSSFSTVTLPYTKTGLTNGTNYDFIVRAHNASGYSANSAEVSAAAAAISYQNTIQGEYFIDAGSTGLTLTEDINLAAGYHLTFFTDSLSNGTGDSSITGDGVINLYIDGVLKVALVAGDTVGDYLVESNGFQTVSLEANWYDDGTAAANTFSIPHY